MPLTVEQYARGENEARMWLSFSEIMAYAPRTFEALGFPARISDERELARYADWNFDPGNQEYFRPGKFLRGPSLETVFTADEARMINAVCDGVVRLTKNLGGPCVRPLCNPIAQLGLFRIIHALQNLYGQQLSVLEIGPGSGYLGAYLAMNGYRYASIDNAQALYLWQSRLLEELVGSDFSEWANLARGPGKQHRVIHFPWWQYVRMYDQMPLEADVVISNTNLGEMTNHALRYTLQFSRKILANSKVKLLVYADVGDTQQNSKNTIEGALGKAGFERVHEALFNAWVLKEGKTNVRRGTLEKRIPLYNPSGHEERIAAVDFLFLPPDQHPLDLGFTRIVQNWVPPIGTEEAVIDARYRGSSSRGT